MSIVTVNKILWKDGEGNLHDITKMSDEYVKNCIAWLQRRKNEFDAVAEEHGYDLSDYTDEDYDWIETFLQELCRRGEEEITIPREEGCEYEEECDPGIFRY